MSLRNLILNLVVFIPMMVSNPITRNPRPTAPIRNETAAAVPVPPQAHLPPGYQDTFPEFSGITRFLPSTSGMAAVSSETGGTPRFHLRPRASRIERKPHRRIIARMPRPNFNASVQLVVGPVGAASQGTITCLPGEGLAIVTHDHFHSPSLDSRDNLYLKRFGDGSFTGHVDIRSHTPESTRFDEVNLIPLGEDCQGSTTETSSSAGGQPAGSVARGEGVVCAVAGADGGIAG